MVNICIPEGTKSRDVTTAPPPPLPTLFKEFTNLVSLHVNFLFGIFLLTPPHPLPSIRA